MTETQSLMEYSARKNQERADAEKAKLITDIPCNSPECYGCGNYHTSCRTQCPLHKAGYTDHFVDVNKMGQTEVS